MLLLEMKLWKIRTFGVSALLAAVLAWLYGGAQVGFYRTYYNVMEYDEILGIEYPVQVDAFLPGVETLAVGFALFSAAFIVCSAIEARRARRPEF